MRAIDDNVITVSYGSFSVTLVGQENPFETLKKVTDYFSHLAQTNPNFGAIPQMPIPDLMVETTSAPRQVQTPQPFDKTPKSDGSKYILQPEATDNLWQEPVPKYNKNPLVLKQPVPPRQASEETLIAAANQALEAPKIPAPRQPPSSRSKSQFLSNNYPFRHFPLRRPGHG